MDVTFSKQWIHFLRSLRCPPTSNILSTCVSNKSCFSRGCEDALNAELAHREARLVYTRRFRSGAEHVGFIGNVIRLCYSLRMFKEAVSMPLAFIR